MDFPKFFQNFVKTIKNLTKKRNKKGIITLSVLFYLEIIKNGFKPIR